MNIVSVNQIYIENLAASLAAGIVVSGSDELITAVCNYADAVEEALPYNQEIKYALAMWAAFTKHYPRFWKERKGLNESDTKRLENALAAKVRRMAEG